MTTLPRARTFARRVSLWVHDRHQLQFGECLVSVLRLGACFSFCGPGRRRESAHRSASIYRHLPAEYGPGLGAITPLPFFLWPC